jgi:hypothetical protein
MGRFRDENEAEGDLPETNNGEPDSRSKTLDDPGIDF